MSHSAQTVRLDQSNLEADYVAPQNSTQTQLVEIWEQLLEITPISIRDNFFEIGGDSLLAVRLFAQI